MTTRTRLLVLLLAALLVACNREPALTRTPGGELLGYVEAGVEHYLGIPYARPPVGDLRWQPPQPVAPWQGTLTVQHNPPACLQFIPLKDTLVGSEDCLYLNVWTPVDRPQQPLPVMVWLHGGGFILGKGSYGNDDGRKLAARGKVVVVTVDYRLGVFGFMAHEALGGQAGGSGNYGIQDQTAALRWVRDNISAFGGDPDNVTLFGQSAGAISVCAQLVSPAASGLFQRAVIQSGPCATPLPALAAANALGDQVSAGLGCAGAKDIPACLRASPAQAVADVLPPDPTLGFNKKSTLWWPVLDGQVLPLQFMQAFESGRFNRVPVINGTTRDEATLLIWMSHDLWLKPLRADQYMARLLFLLGSRELAELVAAQYPLQNFADPTDALVAAFSDGFFKCQSRQQALALGRHVPVWAYQFDYDRAPFLIPWAELGAFHAAEIQYVFDQPMRLTRGDFSASESDLVDSMMGYWTEFARNGDPNGSDRLFWPRHDTTGKTLLFNLANTVASGVDEEACRFWDALDYLRPVYGQAAAHPAD